MTSMTSGLRPAVPAPHGCGLASDPERIEIADRRTPWFSVTSLAEALRSDRVVLVRNAFGCADQIMGEVAAALGLSMNLEAQAAFASIQGHRQNVSKYFMTVNRRNDFAIVLPHSEGSRFSNIQIASFYCHENTTDGGVSIMLNYNQASPAWTLMKERVARLDPHSRPLTATQKAVARARFLADTYPGPEDRVLEEPPAVLEGVRLLWVLTPLRKSFSALLQREVYSSWDSVASFDLDAVEQCVSLMGQYDLLREPPKGPRIDHCDPAFRRTVWSSGVRYDDIYQSMIIRKLQPGELIIQNNLTWAHATSNWTPGSGSRSVIAAFA